MLSGLMPVSTVRFFKSSRGVATPNPNFMATSRIFSSSEEGSLQLVKWGVSPLANRTLSVLINNFYC